MRKVRVSLKNNESGMVSIMVTMILIIIMTLIVLAMSQDSNRQQRQSLDRQLSDQAFYNAESGINVWKKYLEDNSSSPLLLPQKNNCDMSLYSGPAPKPVPEVVNADPNNQFSCVLYDRAPQTLEFSDLAPGEGQTMDLVPLGGGLINNLTFGWSYDGNTGCPAASLTLTSYLPASCQSAALEITLIDPTVTPLTRDNLMRNTYIIYALPVPGGPGVDNYQNRVSQTINSQGGRVLANCGTGGCTVRISSINKTKLTMHISTLYATPKNIVISGESSPGVPVKFVGAQTMIDSTGKSADILRRVRVRVPVQSIAAGIGMYPIRTSSPICKLITVDKASHTATLESGPSGANCPTN